MSTFLHGRRGQTLIGEAPTLLQHHPWSTALGPALLQALCPPAHPKEPPLVSPHSLGHQDTRAAANPHPPMSPNPLHDSPGGT